LAGSRCLKLGMKPLPVWVRASAAVAGGAGGDALEGGEHAEGVALAVDAVAEEALLGVDHGALLQGGVAAELVDVDHLEDPGHLAGVYIEHAALGVGGRAAPFAAAVEAGEDEGAFAAGGREGLLLDDVPALGHVVLRLGGDVGDVVEAKGAAGEAGRLGGDGLGLGGEFADEVGGGHGLFFDGEEGFAGLAVEEEDVGRFGDLGDGVDLLAVVLHGHEVGRGGQIAVPQIVVDGLKVPLALAGVRIEREEGVGEEVVAVAVAAVEIEGGGAGGHIDDAALRVEAHAGPGVGGAGVGVGFGGPGFIAEFAGLGDGVEDPGDGAGADVEGADVAGGGGQGFVGAEAEDVEVLVDHAGGGGGHGEVFAVVAQAEGEVHFAARAETLDGLAGGGIQRVEVGAGREEDAPFGAVGPPGEAATHGLLPIRRGEGPLLRARGRIQREDLHPGRHAIEHATDNEGVALDLAQLRGVAALAGIGPGHFKLGGVFRRDLGEGRVVGAVLAAEIGGPVGVLRGGAQGAQREQTGTHTGMGHGRRALSARGFLMGLMGLMSPIGPILWVL
jgi:hypothetical protein